MSWLEATKSNNYYFCRNKVKVADTGLDAIRSKKENVVENFSCVPGLQAPKRRIALREVRNELSATVVAVHRDRYELLYEQEMIYARLKTTEFYNQKEVVDFPTVGDEVKIIYQSAGDSLITRVKPRRSVFTRVNVTEGMPDQAVAANFDYVFITTSLNHEFHVSKLERYLTAAWQSGGTPVVILTKVDLCEDAEPYLQAVENMAPGVKVHCISSVTGAGVSELAPYLGKGNTIVLLGSSGVGKSSLSNLLLGESRMLTGEIREADSQGRHTTTYKQCLFLPERIELPDGSVLQGGGRIIDTPGMRVLVPAEAKEGLQSAFWDIEALAESCRFTDCRHQQEPGCAIRRAIEDGRLSERRFRSWFDMQREDAHYKARQSYLKRRMEKRSARAQEKPRKKNYTIS